jgi:hypothetical protein
MFFMRDSLTWATSLRKSPGVAVESEKKRGEKMYSVEIIQSRTELHLINELYFHNKYGY